MNIYDFDNTIIKGDSSVKFIKYSLLRHPLLVIGSLFKASKEWIKSLFGRSNLGFIKSELFSFVKDLDNLDNYMEKFVLKNMVNIKDFYLKQHKDSDIVISASFAFIIKPFCAKLGINNVIATKYDVEKGKIIGENCKGTEKVKRLQKEFPKIQVAEAYSDSLSDIPMLQLAQVAYLVKGEKIISYQITK